MQIPCPYCDRKFPIEAALNDKAARDAVAVALKMPAPLGDLILRYITLFRPAKSALNWARAGRLMQELLNEIQSGVIQRKGRTHATSLAVWQQGLERLLDRRGDLTLPLTSHGFLHAIVADLAGKAAGEQEARMEAQRRAPAQPRGEGPVSAGSVAQQAVDRTRLREGLSKFREDTGL